MRGEPGDIDDLLVVDERNPSAPRGRFRVLWFLLAIALLAGAVYGTVRLSERLNPGGGATSPGQTVASQVAGTPESAVEQFQLPASCDELYPKDIAKRLARTDGMEVNPEWYLAYTGASDQANWTTSVSRTLGEALDEAPRLTCAWVPSSAPAPGPTDEIPAGATAADLIDGGIVTMVAELTPAQLQVVIRDISSRAEKCYEQNGGLRCNLTYDSELGYGDGAQTRTTGESYAVRGNLLIASRWLTNIDGYTQAVTANVIEAQ